MSTVFLNTIKNTMKRHPLSGTDNLSPPRTSAYGMYVTNYTVPHDLGYVPVFRYYYEPFGDGIIWPPLADRASLYAISTLNTSITGPGLVGWADSSNLYLQLFYQDANLTNTYPVYWVIYKDFSLT